MSKTVSTCILETNLVPNQPQENIFFHTLYRTMADFPGEFVRTARSNSPIQVVALFSTQGSDTNAATLNIELNQELTKIVTNAQGQPVLDFESFSYQVVNILNVHVCNFIVSHGGQPLRTSMTMAVIEGDTLRIIHIGNTKAVLVRDGKIMALTDEQTIAHRYVQMGAISPAEELNHPDRFTLTQYLGKMPQDGAVMPDKKVHLKLKDNDSLCLMGLGVSKLMPAKNRNAILVQDIPTEVKAHEIINTAGNLGVKYGLSFAVVQVESTLILPGDAVLAGRAAAAAAPVVEETPFVDNDPFANTHSDNRANETTVFNRGNNAPAAPSYSNYDSIDIDVDKKSNGSIGKAIIRTLIVFIICAVVGFGACFGFFYFRGLLDFSSKPSEVLVDTMYIVADGTSLYSQPSEDSTVVTTLSAGEAVLFLEDQGTYSKVSTINGVAGYVLSVSLSSERPDVPEVAASAAPETPVDATAEFIPDDDPMAGEPVVTESAAEGVEEAIELVATEETN